MFSSIPTDNFYKFQFITGVVVLIFLFIYFNEQIREEDREIINIHGKLDKIEYKLDTEELTVPYIERLMEDFGANFTKEDLANKYSIHLEDRDEINTELITANTQLKLLKTARDNIIIYSWGAGVALPISLFCIVSGYVGWRKHQKKQDALLEAEVEIKQNELSNMEQN